MVAGEGLIIPRKYLILAIVAIVLVALAFASYEISLHLNMAWQAVHSVADAPNFVSHHP